jgi:hypothetical protein
MIGEYILNEHGEPVLLKDRSKWAEWMGNPEHVIVRQEEVGESRISTVFLGLNYNFESDGSPPILWETMVFNGPLDQLQVCCAGSREQAEAMHRETVERVKAHAMKEG